MNWVRSKIFCKCYDQSSDFQFGVDCCERYSLYDDFSRDEIKSICSWFHLNNYAEIERLTPYHFKNRWEGVLEDSLSAKWIEVLFRDSSEDMSKQLWERLHMLLTKQWRARAYDRAVITMAILAPDNEDTVKCSRITEYVDDVMSSLLRIWTFIDNIELKKWSVCNNFPEFNSFCSLRQYVLKDLSNRDSVDLAELELWLESVRVFRDILGEVCSLCVNLKPPARQLIPTPLCTTKSWTPVINLGHLIFLSSELQEDDTVEWRLLYSKEMHGGNLQSFETHTRDKGPTLLFIKDEHNGIFGAYVPHSWTTGEYSYGNNRCFLFTLSPEMNVFKPSGFSADFHYFYDGPETRKRGVGLGENTGSYTLWLEDGLNRGKYSRDCLSFNKYQMPILLPAFKLIELQVWATRDRCECKQHESNCELEEECVEY